MPVAQRKPQINFQVEPCMKHLYLETKQAGAVVTRLCAAGFLMLVESPQLRLAALNRLREWEAEYEQADPDEIRDFVQQVEAAMTGAAPKSRPARKARRTGKRARRS